MCCCYYPKTGTPAPIRTEKTAPFERADFTNLSTGALIKYLMKNLKDYVNQTQLCSLPWIATEINLQSNKIRPCCKFIGNLGDVSSEFPVTWFNKDFKNLRTELISNAPNLPGACLPCNVPAVAFSYKNWKNSSYQALLDVNVEEPTLPKVFNFSLKNTCNLACRMCNPAQSSKLEHIVQRNQTLQNFYELPSLNNKIDVNQLRGSFSEARYITFGGAGELTIDEDCLHLIKIISEESKKLFSINFSTNMMIVNDELLSILSKMNCRVVLSISIDGPPHINDYIRYKSNWSTILKNMKYISTTYPRIQFAINTTLSVLNVGYAIETLEFFHELEREISKPFLHLMISPVLDKEFLHPNSLPDYCKEQYLEKLKSYKKTPTIIDSVKLIPTAIQLLEEPVTCELRSFKTFITEFDKVANTNVLEVYPEFAKWIGTPD